MATRKRTLRRATGAASAREMRKTWGGVSPRPRAPAIQGVETLVRPRATVPPTAGAFPGFVYNGGPVIATPQVYTSFWGPLWSQDRTHRARAERLSKFHADLLQSGFMNVLSQYGVGSGAGAAGAFVQATFVSSVPATLTDPSIRRIIQSSITAGLLPEPANPSPIRLEVVQSLYRACRLDSRPDPSRSYASSALGQPPRTFLRAESTGRSHPCCLEPACKRRSASG